MDVAKYLTEKDKERQDANFLSFKSEELAQFRADEVNHIIEYFHGDTLMKLPEEEVAFFEWLKENDREVWDDLWGDEEDFYLVSIDFLKQFTGENFAFPICDLVETDNYWFSNRHLKPEGLEEIQALLMKVQQGETLKAHEMFLLQLSSKSFDLWHFCYKNNYSPNAMKAVIDEMVYRGWLVHLKEREDLVKYLDF